MVLKPIVQEDDYAEKIETNQRKVSSSSAFKFCNHLTERERVEVRENETLIENNQR
jgi:hypothetical protein